MRIIIGICQGGVYEEVGKGHEQALADIFRLPHADIGDNVVIPTPGFAHLQQLFLVHAHVLQLVDLHLDAADFLEFLDHSGADDRIVVPVGRPVDDDGGALVFGIGICIRHADTHAKYQCQCQ